MADAPAPARASHRHPPRPGRDRSARDRSDWPSLTARDTRAPRSLSLRRHDARRVGGRKGAGLDVDRGRRAAPALRSLCRRESAAARRWGARSTGWGRPATGRGGATMAPATGAGSTDSIRLDGGGGDRHRHLRRGLLRRRRGAETVQVGAADEADAHPREPLLLEAQEVGCLLRQIDDAAAHEGTAIVDAHDDGAAVVEIGDAHIDRHRQRGMRGRDHGAVEDLAVRGQAAVERSRRTRRRCRSGRNPALPSGNTRRPRSDRECRPCIADWPSARGGGGGRAGGGGGCGAATTGGAGFGGVVHAAIADARSAAVNTLPAAYAMLRPTRFAAALDSPVEQ